MAKKNKLVTSAVAIVTAAALLLGGTFAWQSINQTALNEASDVINPGGRLHDDFDGSNKDIYVENFAEEDIFARIQLSEYFEIVLNYNTAGEKTETIIGNKTQKTDAVGNLVTDEDGNPVYEYTYIPYIFGTANEDGTFNAGNGTDEGPYWSWTTGGSTIFMPTFNKNKDSLAADLNGNYVDAIGGISNRDEVQYENYKEYTDGEEKTANAIYDIDPNMADELANAGVDISDLIANGGLDTAYETYVKLVYETHKAKSTGTAELISMAEWLAKVEADGGYDAELHGNYWVYDTDGWVYWSAPIGSGEATGLLLDEIALTGVMDDTWYYAINVVAQFVTAGDTGSAQDGTGFYDTTNGTAPSDDALTLLNKIGVNDTTPGRDEDDSGDDEGYYGSWISVGGQYADTNGYIYLSCSADDIVQNKFTVNADYELNEDGLTVKLSDMASADTIYDPDTQTLTIAPHDMNAITISATTVDGETETVKVVPIYDTLIVTPAMDGTTITLIPGPYTLVPQDFTNNDNVTFEVEWANRSDIITMNEQQTLSISSSESQNPITLVATTTNENETVRITVNIGGSVTPNDDPEFSYYVMGSGSLTGAGVNEGETLYWKAEQNVIYNFAVSLIKSFEGEIQWELEVPGELENVTADFMEPGEDPTNIGGYIQSQEDKISGINCYIRVFDGITETTPFTLKCTITPTGEEPQTYSWTVNAYPNNIVLPDSLDFEPTDISLGYGESAEVSFSVPEWYDTTLTNADVTWSMEENPCFTIAEGDESGTSATVTHNCTDSNNCESNCSICVRVTYDAVGYTYDGIPVSAYDEGDNEEESVIPTITYGMSEMPFAIPSGTSVSLGVADYEGGADAITYYIIDYANNNDLVPGEYGYFTNELEAKDGVTVLALEGSYMGQPLTQYFYGKEISSEEIAVFSTDDTSKLETVTFVAAIKSDDGTIEEIIAEVTTKIYDSETHTYLGNASLPAEGDVPSSWYLAFVALDASGVETGSYCAALGTMGCGELYELYPIESVTWNDEYEWYDIAGVSENACDGTHVA